MILGFLGSGLRSFLGGGGGSGGLGGFLGGGGGSGGFLDGFYFSFLSGFLVSWILDN